jgi:hypothetical protein
MLSLTVISFRNARRLHEMVSSTPGSVDAPVVDTAIAGVSEQTAGTRHRREVRHGHGGGAVDVHMLERRAEGDAGGVADRPDAALNFPVGPMSPL